MMEPGHQRRKGSDPNGNIAALNELTAGFDSDHSPVRSNDRVYRRNANIKGPMHAFDYSYIEDRLGVEQSSGLALQGAVAYHPTAWPSLR